MARRERVVSAAPAGRLARLLPPPGARLVLQDIS
jgi:hypothetical protein